MEVSRPANCSKPVIEGTFKVGSLPKDVSLPREWFAIHSNWIGEREDRIHRWYRSLRQISSSVRWI